jgi:hypothetical protein
LVKPPLDWEAMFTDIQVLGKGEINSLMKWRGKLNNALKKIQNAEAKNGKDDEEDGAAKEENQKELDSEVELAQEILKEQIKERNKIRKEKVGHHENFIYF